MNLLETLLAAQDGGAVRQLGSRFGLDPEQTGTAINALLPFLTGGIKQNVQTQGGLEGLLGALQQGQHSRFLDDASAIESEEATMEGNGILGHILGSKDVSRGVAAAASESTGIGQDVLKQMLPVVAAMAMGALSKSTHQGAKPMQAAAGGGSALDLLSPLLDSDRDGRVGLGDVAGLLGRFFSR